jgi:hypothetical protein
MKEPSPIPKKMPRERIVGAVGVEPTTPPCERNAALLPTFHFDIFQFPFRFNLGTNRGNVEMGFDL